MTMMTLRKTTSALLLVGLFTLLQSATSRGQEAIGSAIGKTTGGSQYKDAFGW